MELVLSSKNFKHLSNQKEDLIIEPSGFLTSEYKNVVKSSYKTKNSTSIFGIKQRIKSRNFITSRVAETTVKLSLFLTIILLIFN
ncbi:hypothetical protein [uncultured Algibacter sp.]|uniref:hypothetical protein n=1 Tax=uncultured Algibacter sp. TaxID=298659 RepID=UPI00262F1153|nr:hypothetical protein [uncultured Algibacter sp.]